jgi:DNA-binding YbaB/EbfC family protein
MMKEAKRMQEQLQERLAELRVEGSAGGGMVTATMDGQKNLLSLKISPDVIVPDDAEMLQDLVVAAVADATRRVEEETQEAMGGMMGGLKIPGLF